jgi:hypothetical protein
VDQDAFVTLLEDDRATLAYKSSGCLLAPEIGDVVLLYVGPGKAAYVLTVLEKAAPTAILEFDEDVRIKAGRVEIEGTGSLCLSVPNIERRGVRGLFGFATLKLVAGNTYGVVRALVRTLRDGLRRLESQRTARSFWTGKLRPPEVEDSKAPTGRSPSVAGKCVNRK